MWEFLCSWESLIPLGNITRFPDGRRENFRLRGVGTPPPTEDAARFPDGRHENFRLSFILSDFGDWNDKMVNAGISLLLGIAHPVGGGVPTPRTLWMHIHFPSNKLRFPFIKYPRRLEIACYVISCRCIRFFSSCHFFFCNQFAGLSSIYCHLTS